MGRKLLGPNYEFEIKEKKTMGLNYSGGEQRRYVNSPAQRKKQKNGRCLHLEGPIPGGFTALKKDDPDALCPEAGVSSGALRRARKLFLTKLGVESYDFTELDGKGLALFETCLDEAQHPSVQ